MRAHVAGIALDHTDPMGKLQEMKDSMLHAINVLAPPDAHSRRVMDEAKNAVVETFGQAAIRVKGNLSK